jgi:hypothetical protein
VKDLFRGIDLDSKPRAQGCEECLATGGWWLHLRRCALCGHIGCCDSSPGQHAAHHAELFGHPVVASFEPFQNWYYDYETDKVFRAARLRPPNCRPATQPAPGPAGKVPPDWVSHLHDVAYLDTHPSDRSRVVVKFRKPGLGLLAAK